MTAPSPKEFRSATGAFVGNCSVVTVGEGDNASGLIVTSTVAPTTDPPRLLACVNRASSSYPLLRTFGCFGWSSLGAGHEEVAKRFSGFGGVSGAARFEGAEWETAVTGARLLKGAPAAFDCTVESIDDREDFAVVIGRVVAIRQTEGAGGLVWWRGGFRALTD